MSCEDLRSEYLLYALGTIADPERAELLEHLGRGCQSCAAGLREARAIAAGLGAAVDGPEPSAELRRRILASAGAAPEKQWSWFTAWITAVATALAGLAVIVYQQQGHRAELALLRGEIERSGMEAASLREALSLIQAPETREVTFGQGQPAPPRGRVFFHPNGVLLVASNLPAPPAGKTYEMWIIRGGKPAAAGLFRSSAQGNAIHLYRSAAPVAPSDVVAVTLESASGADAPTSTPIIVAPL